MGGRRTIARVALEASAASSEAKYSEGAPPGVSGASEALGKRSAGLKDWLEEAGVTACCARSEATSSIDSKLYTWRA